MNREVKTCVDLRTKLVLETGCDVDRAYQNAILRRLAISKTRQTRVEKPDGFLDDWMSRYCGT